MKVLFVSRKKLKSIGGLARFSDGLVLHFLDSSLVLTPENLVGIFKLPFFRPEIMHLCDATLLPVGIILKAIFRKPLSLTAHGLDVTYATPIYQRMIKRLLPKADAVIVDSKALKPIVEKYHVSRQKIHIIHPGISIEHLKNSIDLRFPMMDGNINLLTVGNLVRRKGQRWFIEQVMTKLSPDFNYLIVGDGPERKSIEKLIRGLKLGGRVHLFGQLNDSCLSYLMKKTDIYVCPNIKEEGNFEGFGIAAGEAAAMGLPVVASDVDGISEIIHNEENGWLVEKEPEMFISAIIKLRKQTLRDSLGRKAKIYTRKNFRWEKTLREYQEVFQELIYKN